MQVTYRLLSFLIGYAIGNISFGYILGKIKKKDLKTHGSGNIGATNSLRVLGASAGIITLAFDVLKLIIFKDDNEKHSWKRPPIFIALLVIKLLKSRESKLLHRINIKCISSTFFVSKLFKLRETSDVHSANI